MHNLYNSYNHDMLFMSYGFMPYGGIMMSIIMGILIILPFWFIFKKAGFSKWLSLLMIFPFINIIMIYILAFSTWKSKNHSEDNSKLLND